MKTKLCLQLNLLILFICLWIQGFSQSICNTPPSQDLLQTIPQNQYKTPILNSDGGGQYYSQEFLKLTKNRVRNSMAESVYDNTMAERVNGIIKNEYLKPWSPENFIELKSMLNKAVRNYNSAPPHRSLKMLTPLMKYKDKLNNNNVVIA